MAKEYIEREAALELIDGIYDCNDMVFEKNDSCVGLDCGSCRWRDTKNYIRGRLAHIPAADVVPVRHGRWERKADPYGFFDTIPVCSVCDCTTKWREEYLYCPHCGARMDGDGDAL